MTDQKINTNNYTHMYDVPLHSIITDNLCKKYNIPTVSPVTSNIFVVGLERDGQLYWDLIEGLGIESRYPRKSSVSADMTDAKFVFMETCHQIVMNYVPDETTFFQHLSNFPFLESLAHIEIMAEIPVQRALTEAARKFALAVFYKIKTQVNTAYSASYLLEQATVGFLVLNVTQTNQN